MEEYRGRTRPDMTEGCPEQVDGEFREWVENFNTTVRGEMLAAMQAGGKDCFMFPSREKAYAWLNTFEKA